MGNRYNIQKIELSLLEIMKACSNYFDCYIGMHYIGRHAVVVFCINFPSFSFLLSSSFKWINNMKEIPWPFWEYKAVQYIQGKKKTKMDCMKYAILDKNMYIGIHIFVCKKVIHVAMINFSSDPKKKLVKYVFSRWNIVPENLSLAIQ